MRKRSYIDNEYQQNLFTSLEKKEKNFWNIIEEKDRRIFSVPDSIDNILAEEQILSEEQVSAQTVGIYNNQKRAQCYIWDFFYDTPARIIFNRYQENILTLEFSPKIQAKAMKFFVQFDNNFSKIIAVTFESNDYLLFDGTTNALSLYQWVHQWLMIHKDIINTRLSSLDTKDTNLEIRLSWMFEKDLLRRDRSKLVITEDQWIKTIKNEETNVYLFSRIPDLQIKVVDNGNQELILFKKGSQIDYNYEKWQITTGILFFHYLWSDYNIDFNISYKATRGAGPRPTLFISWHQTLSIENQRNFYTALQNYLITQLNSDINTAP